MDFFPSGEWGVPSQGSAPIVNWLRGVVQKVGERHAQQHIGIIGNCLTGPLPLALLDRPQVSAAVVAQPALPLRFLRHTDADKKSLGLAADDLQYARKSAVKIYGLRFETDCMSDPAKQETLRDEFGDRYMNGEIPATAYQTEGKPVKAHSTLIGSWREYGEEGRPSRDARERVRNFLLKELGEKQPANKE
jgi:dienelactone hydrolase